MRLFKIIILPTSYFECLDTRHFMYIIIMFQNRDSNLILQMKKLRLRDPGGAREKYCMIMGLIKLEKRGNLVAIDVWSLEISTSRHLE